MFQSSIKTFDKVLPLRKTHYIITLMDIPMSQNQLSLGIPDYVCQNFIYIWSIIQ